MSRETGEFVALTIYYTFTAPSRDCVTIGISNSEGRMNGKSETPGTLSPYYVTEIPRPTTFR